MKDQSTPTGEVKDINQSQIGHPVEPQAQPDTAHQTPLVIPPETAKKKKKILLILSTLLLLALIAGLIFTLTRNNTTSTSKQVPQPSIDYLTNSNGVICDSLGLNKIQCQNLATDELTKFDIPSNLKDVDKVFPSPDGKKYILTTFPITSTPTPSTSYLVDDKFSVIKKLAEWGATKDISYKWMADSKQFIVSETLSTTKSAQTISLLNTENNSSKIVYKATQNKIVTLVGGDDKYVYASQINNDPSGPQAKPDNMLAISVSDGSAKKIDSQDIQWNGSEQIAGSGDSANYDPTTKYFYTYGTNASHSEKQYLTVSKLEDNSGNLKITKLQSSDIHVQRSENGPILTTRGTLIENGGQYPRALVSGSNVKTELKLAVGGQGFIFSLSSQPVLTKSTTNQPVIADFVRYPADAPVAIKNYLPGLVTKNCKANNYATIQLMDWLGTSQFTTTEGGCNRDAMYFYIMKNGKYAEVYSTQEGIDCVTRDKLGISSMLTECTKSGEGR